MLLAVLDLGPQQIALIATASFSAFVAGKWLFQKDEAREDRKRHMIDMIAELEKAGLTKMADVMTDLVVGDYSAITGKVSNFLKSLRTAEGLTSSLDELFTKQLAVRMKDAKRLPEIMEAVAINKKMKEVKDEIANTNDS